MTTGLGEVEITSLIGEGEGDGVDTDELLEAADITELASAGLSVSVEEDERGVGLVTFSLAS